MVQILNLPKRLGSMKLNNLSSFTFGSFRARTRMFPNLFHQAAASSGDGSEDPWAEAAAHCQRRRPCNLAHRDMPRARTTGRQASGKLEVAAIYWRRSATNGRGVAPPRPGERGTGASGRPGKACRRSAPRDVRNFYADIL